MTRATRYGLVALVLVLVASVALGTATAVAQPDEPTNETITDSAELEGKYSLETLRSGGRTVSGADPSTRWLGDSGSMYVDYSSANPLTSGKTEEWEAENLLANGDLVRVNELTFHATRLRNAESETYELVVVYWTEGTRQRGNATVPVANVQAEDRKELPIEGAFAHETVDLRRSDESRRVTMWLEDSSGDRVDGAQWTFKHHSLATAADAGIDGEGDYLSRALMEFLLPIAGRSFVVGGAANRGVKRAGVGPQYGYVPWIVGLTLATFIFVSWQFTTLADLVARAPLILSAYVVGIVGIVVLEGQQSNVKETVFLRPHLVDVANARGDDAKDSLLADMKTEKVVDLHNGAKAVVRPGVRPFLSRVFGGKAVLDPSRPLTTEINLAESEWDQLILVDPDADETLDYTPEGWKFEVPELTDWGDALEIATGGAVTVGIVLLVGFLASWAWGIGAGLVVIALVCATPTETAARVDPANGHERAAFISMMYLAENHDDAETLESARKKLIRERARSERDVDEALETQDATLVEEMFGSDVDRRLVDDASSATDSSDDRDRERADQEIPEVPADD
ncbi:hypothetical protein [Halopiger thermotolerans]